MNKLRKSKYQAGIGSPTILGMVGGMMMVGMGMASLTTVSDVHSGRGSDKVESNLLAETAIQAMYDTIRDDMRSERAYSSSISTKTLEFNSAVTGGKKTAGTYYATVRRVMRNDTTVDMGGGSVATRENYRFLIEGTGVSYNGITSVIQAEFQAVMDRSNGVWQEYDVSANVDGVGNGIEFTVCPGAISANARVRFTTMQGFRTYSPDKDAHVVANKGFVWYPAKGSKSSLINPNIFDLEGTFQVPGSPEYSYIYDSSVGPSGLGNSNGYKNYRTPQYAADDHNAEIPANTVVRRAYPRPFPSQDMFNAWRDEWLTFTTNHGTKFTKDVNSSSMPPDPDTGKRFLRAPAVIDGDLLVTGGQELKLLPSSDKPYENIIYVKGDVKNLGLLKNLGVTLVMDGKYSDQKGSVYGLEATDSPYGDLTTVTKNANLMSFSPDADAFKFTTDSSSTVGLIYATTGGIQIEGSNAEFTGKLAAAGNSDNADMVIDPQDGASFVIHYDKYAGGPRNIVASAETVKKRVQTVAPGTIIKQFDPGKMMNWRQVK